MLKEVTFSGTRASREEGDVDVDKEDPIASISEGCDPLKDRVFVHGWRRRSRAQTDNGVKGGLRHE